MQMHGTTIQISGEIKTSDALNALAAALSSSLVNVMSSGQGEVKKRLLDFQNDKFGKRPFETNDHSVDGNVDAILEVAIAYRIDILFSIHDPSGFGAKVFYVENGARSSTVTRSGLDLAVTDAMIAELTAKGSRPLRS
ncbi:hypothetical protein HFO56_23120 [Rhizobium laguerreae]|uniref:hypothetical protein n=1 Tax=Rhizobium laguerreae TaxID=1076926 RepID=UPI001C8FD7A0|nr:hypothetical protein [Rhizobium laguerreae]MBY3155217.1 hypothetical protein [Rhizobium laguerreae]